MAVAPRPWQVAPTRPKKSRSLAVVRPTVHPLPSPAVVKKSSPLLQTLQVGKQLTQWVAIASITTAVGLYAGKAYTQKNWSEAFQQLLQLQEHEAHLIATNASLSEHFRQQAAQPSAGLIDPTSAHNLYLPKPTEVKLPEAPAAKSVHPREQAPVGY
ncbi:hypothetical protein FLX56_24470 [Synechococcus moorigangaii CMS01]|nr:hypothetical protein [Synechococcus moorigangaii CMS01]